MKISEYPIYFLVTLLLYATSFAFAQDSKETDSEECIILGNRKSADKWLKENNVPAIAVAIIREGKVVKNEVYGELKKDMPAPQNTIFNVASLTKPVVTMLTLKLISDGSWLLDEPLDKYWIDPDVVDDPRHKKLTTRHILTHQTGFAGNWRKNHETKKLTFDFEPGAKLKYSGEGFEYLRRSLEAKFDKTIEHLADSLIFRPLDMKNTRFVWEEDLVKDRYAFNHDKGGNLLETIKSKEANAANNLLTTIDDYAKFAQYVVNGGGLKPEVFNEMKSYQVESKYESFFGLGWEILPDWGGEEVIMHSGGNPGVRTLVILLPKSKKGVVLFTNSDTGGFYPVWTKIVTQSLD